MSLVVLGLFALQMDKGNISNALTTSFNADIGVSKNTINDGNQLQLAAIVIFEIPFNMIQPKIGASIWLTFECISWGLVCLFQAFIKDKSSFYATRFLLGMFEAGFLPGAILLLSCFYTRGEMVMRTTILYIGNYLASGVGSLVAAGVFKMSGARGLSGWLFLIDGSFTVLVSFAFFLFLPRDTNRTRPLCGLRCLDFFTERDRHILSHRVVVDDPNKRIPLTTVTLREALKILTNWRLWGHCIINILALAPKGGLQLYSPTIVQSLGFDTIKANALSSVSNYGVIILALIAAYISDRTRFRGPVCLMCGVYSLIFAGVQYSLTTSDAKWTKYAIFMLLNSGNAVAQGINDAWLASNARDAKERCLGLALCVIGSNLGGLCGQQLFKSQDAPRFTSAFLTVMCLYAGSIVLIAMQMVMYVVGNRRLKRSEDNGEYMIDNDGHIHVKYDI